MARIVSLSSSRKLVAVAGTQTASFSSCRHVLAAYNFAMPAMSPTMTEGGIVEWKFKEGDSFSAGDVLLEIETDKAQIDVEASDDGVIAKIYSTDGQKEIPVGKTIAALADPGDDIKTISLPEPDSGASAASKPESVESPRTDETKPSESRKESKPEKTKQPSSNTSQANPDQTLLPSVQKLLKEQDISSDRALKEIQASGPKGRILKGDVLAFIGTIPEESVQKVSDEIKKLESLDLSNIKPAKPKTEDAKEKVAEKDDSKSKEQTSSSQSQAPPKPQPITSVYALANIKNVAAEFSASLGGSPATPVQNLVEKAVKLALKDVPKYSQPKPSVLRDPVFESILDTSRREKPFEYKLIYPQKLGSHSVADIYDILGSSKKPLRRPHSARLDSSELLTVQVIANSHVKSSKHKAQTFLDRLGYYLGEGSGNLFL